MLQVDEQCHGIYNHHHHTLLHEGQYTVERLADGELLFKRPDSSALSPEPIHGLSSELPSAMAQPWSWCGEFMDYDLALFALSSQTRESIKNSGPVV